MLSGVTLITHGQGGSAGGDVARTSDLIAKRAGGAAQYVMSVGEDDGDVTVTSFAHDADTPRINEVPSGEMIIRLDWSDANTTGTVAIARAVADFMAEHKLVEQELHLAGPSRGASVVSNLAAALGERGVWVDQVTYIDPVPAGGVVPGLGDFVDGPMRVTENVVFADNYWRSDDNLATGFDGQPVDGAHNVSLNQTVQVDNAGDPHVGAGAYYIATIDPDATIVSPAKSTWFKGTPAAPGRDQAGFAFSRISAGAARPAGGLGPIVGGSAERDGVDASGAQWANVRDVALIGGASSVAAGKTIRVALRYGDADSRATVSVFLDRDRNPYNDNSVTRLARRALARSENGGARLSGSTVEASPGTYYLYAQVTDPQGNVHYDYAEQSLRLTSPGNDLKFASVSNGVLNVNGTGGLDRIYATAGGDSYAVTRHDFTQVFPAASVNSIVIDGGAGDDSIVLGSGVPGTVLVGGAGNDILIGSDGNDTLNGGAGRDRLLAGGGDDRVSGGGGNDFLDAGSGADRLYGDSGTDQLFAGAGNDYLVGGSDADASDGGPGTDRAERDAGDTFAGIERLLG